MERSFKERLGNIFDELFHLMLDIEDSVSADSEVVSRLDDVTGEIENIMYLILD